MTGTRSPALFLDRDGVINEDFGYVHKPEDTVFMPGIFDLVNAANSAGYKVVVVTNQAGIGRGYYSESDFHEYMSWQKSQFKNHGGRIDAIYYCPHHPNFGVGEYRLLCSCRKPKPGLIHKAVLDLGLNLSLSVLVGDKLSDIACGIAAGVATNAYFHSHSMPTAPLGAIRIKKLLELYAIIARRDFD